MKQVPFFQIYMLHFSQKYVTIQPETGQKETVIQKYYSKEEIPVKSTVIITEKCSLWP